MQLAQALFGQLLLTVLFDVPGINSDCRQLCLSPIVRPHHTMPPMDVHPLQDRLYWFGLVVKKGLGITWLQVQVERGAFSGVDWALSGQRSILVICCFSQCRGPLTFFNIKFNDFSKTKFPQIQVLDMTEFETQIKVSYCTCTRIFMRLVGF